MCTALNTSKVQTEKLCTIGEDNHVPLRIFHATKLFAMNRNRGTIGFDESRVDKMYGTDIL